MIFETTLGLTENYLKTNYKEYYDNMINFVSEEELTLSEKIWLFQNNLNERPICLNESCFNKVSFIKFYKGYRKYCSKSCAASHTHKNDDVKDKRIKKLLECNFDQNLREQMTEKTKETKSNFTKEKKEEINDKRLKTNLQKWGVENISKNEEIKNKISTTLKQVLPKLKLEKVSERIKEIGFEIVKIDENKNYKLKCKKCLNVFSINSALFNQRNRFDIEICLNCNPNNNNSDFENKVLEFITENYPNQILSKFKNFKKYEIDIYLPELNLGLECNGLFWHSEKYKENNYHINKTNFFKEKGIQIIHIWEDDWKFKSEIIKSRLLNILKITKETIPARKCEIKEISSLQLKSFLTQNHLQGNINSKIKLGLFYKNELVSVMSFGNLRINLGRKNVDKHFELLRFCSKINTNVVGGSSKLLKYFINNYKPEKVISYASLDWSSGNLYEKLGFNFIKTTNSNYFYFHKDSGIRLNRFNFRKDKLVKEGFDKAKSEHQIMLERGFFRIYDTGSLLYELITNKKEDV